MEPAEGPVHGRFHVARRGFRIHHVDADQRAHRGFGPPHFALLSASTTP